MYHWLIIGSILSGLSAAQLIAYPASAFGTCSYTGDPHLIPFPTSPGQVSNMYFCPITGWQIVLQNQWVLIAVQSSTTPYVILDYVVFFFNADSSVACVLIGSSGYSTCPAGSPVLSTTNPGGTSWNHFYPLAQFFDLQISSSPWGTFTRYDFYIRETFNLINQSSGLCVKFNCPLEAVLTPPPPIVIQICDIYIGAAQRQVKVAVTQTRVQFIRTACQNDLTLSFDLRLAQTAAVHLIYSSLDQIAGKNYQDAVMKAEVNIQTALNAANSETAAILNQDNSCFEQKRCFTDCPTSVLTSSPATVLTNGNT
jgi:hypothetical protein